MAWHSLRPGSGRLSVSLTADGPTRLITIRDQSSPQAGWIEGGPDDDEDGVSNTTFINLSVSSIFMIICNLT